MIKKVLVFGASGAMGLPLLDILSQKKEFDVYATSRRHYETESVTWIEGNAKEIEFLRRVLSENHYDVIIDFLVYTTNEFEDRAKLLLNSTSQYIFISSARVYADSEEKITENSPRLLDVCTDLEYLSTDEYALSKARQENVLFESKKTNWTIIRPSLTYNENRLQLGVYEKENWLYRTLKGRSIVFSEDLMNNYYTLSYGRDVSSGIAALVGNNNALGESFNIVCKKSFKWSEILSIYCGVIEKKIGIKPNVVMTEKCTNLQIPNAKYQVVYGRYFNRHFDNTKISRVVDTTNWLLPQEGLARCLDAFLDYPTFLPIDWRMEALIDRAADEWTSVYEIKGKRTKLIYYRYRLLG